jgi:Bacterial Ig domain
MKLLLLFFTSLFAYQLAFSQCTPATVRGTATINTPNYALNTAFNANATAAAAINNLSSGMFNFTATVAGTATWSGGVQLQNDVTVGNYIFVQPNNTDDAATVNVATYTFQFVEPVTNFSIRCAGLNNQDQLIITAFNGVTPITIGSFTDNVAHDGSGVIVISGVGGNILTGNNTGGGTGVITNRITLNIPGPVTRIVMTSGKADDNNSTVTLGFTSASYTRCVKVPPDVNATFVNAAITGNVGTNDIKPTGTTYGTATAIPGNPGPAVPTINPDGTYSFTSAVAGVFRFTVPMCPGSVVVPDCALVDLSITVSEPTLYTNNPFANTDMTTTPINTAVTLNTLANDKAGNNSSVGLNPASVTVTTAPLHGTTSVNTTTGAITFTPTAGYTGFDVLTYQVCDLSTPTPKCATSTQIITIEPAGSTNSTVAADDYNSTPLNTPVNGNLKNNDSDPQANTQTITAQNTTIPGKGTLVLNTSGAYTFTPVSGFTGPVNFPYQTCDNGAPVACTNATLYILVFSSFALPLDIISFNAVADNANTKLSWVSENQLNVNRFEIERSPVNPVSYSVVGTVPVNSGSGGTYSFTDVNAKSYIDKGFYRLKIIDNDGKFSYSRIGLVNFGKQLAITIRPTMVNAGQPIVILTGSSSSQKTYSGMLYNQAGQIIEKWNAGIGSFKQIETTGLSKGIYILQIIHERGVTTEKIIIQ